MKEGVDHARYRPTLMSCCSRGRGTDRSRNRCTPCESWMGPSSLIPAEVRGWQFEKCGSAGRGRARTAWFRDARIGRRFVEVEVATAPVRRAQAKEVERANEPSGAVAPAGTCVPQRHRTAASASASVR